MSSCIRVGPNVTADLHRDEIGRKVLEVLHEQGMRHWINRLWGWVGYMIISKENVEIRSLGMLNVLASVLVITSML